MEEVLKLMPLEDKEIVVELLNKKKEIKYNRRKCLSCKERMNILQVLKKRVITCPHCNMKIETRL